MIERDDDTMRAMCMLANCTHGCKMCGWIGGYVDLHKRRAAPGEMPHPICNCPQCGHAQAIARFRYFSRGTGGHLIPPTTFAERSQND